MQLLIHYHYVCDSVTLDKLIPPFYCTIKRLTYLRQYILCLPIRIDIPYFDSHKLRHIHHGTISTLISFNRADLQLQCSLNYSNLTHDGKVAGKRPPQYVNVTKPSARASAVVSG